jgi:hypothetical protein
MGWMAAPSVRLGLTEADTLWPNRNKASDGIIGNTSHSSRISDHNPDSRGIVHAFDLTHDPSHGVDCSVLANHLRSQKDTRIRYVIWNGRLFRGPWSDAVLAGRAKPWFWETYTGDNSHTKHMHVSIGYDRSAENDLRPWWDIMGLSENDKKFLKEEIRDDTVSMITVGRLNVDSERETNNLGKILESLGNIDSRLAAIELALRDPA